MACLEIQKCKTEHFTSWIGRVRLSYTSIVKNARAKNKKLLVSIIKYSNSDFQVKPVYTTEKLGPDPWKKWHGTS